MTARPDPGRHSRREPGRPGFTLVEILVSLVVFSLVLLALERGFQAATLVFERQRGLLAAQAELGALDRFLRGVIQYADAGGARSGPVFVGRAHGFALRGPLPQALAEAPAHARDPAPGSDTTVADMRLSVDGGHRLVLLWTAYRHVTEASPPPRQEVLLSGVQDIDCSYYSAGHWNDGWYGNGLPALVRVRIVFPAGDRRRWPDIVAAPLTEPMPG
jgi:general secretion pathway protein J